MIQDIAPLHLYNEFKNKKPEADHAADVPGGLTYESSMELQAIRKDFVSSAIRHHIF